MYCRSLAYPPRYVYVYVGIYMYPRSLPWPPLYVHIYVGIYMSRVVMEWPPPYVSTYTCVSSQSGMVSPICVYVRIRM